MATTGLINSVVTGDGITSTGTSGSTTATPSTAASIAAMYQNTLGRAPDAAGAAYWANQVNSGAMTTDQVQAAIAGSTEAKSIASTPASTPASTTVTPASNTGSTTSNTASSSTNAASTANTTATPTQAQIDAITNDYSSSLGRAPDASGAAYWEGQLASGAMTADQVQAAIAGSSEGKSVATTNAAAADASIIASDYQNYLGRGTDASGAAYWQQQITSGAMTPDQVATAIQNSPEGLAYAASKVKTPVTPVTTPTSTQAVAGTGTASTVDLTAPQMTIAGNIGNYLDPNSSTNQLLATKAREAANATGTANSSMTDSAISNGIIANAQQMAQNDQSTYASGATTNANLLTTTSNDNASLSTNASIANANNASQQIIAQMNNANQLAMTNLNNANKTLLQSSSAATNIYQTAIQQIATIQANSTMNQATKDQQTSNIINTTNAALADQTAITNINVGANFAGLSVGGTSGSTSATVGNASQVATANQAAAATAAANAVTADYTASLGRTPDAAGLAYWQNQITSGAMTPAQVSAAIASSSEAQQNANNSSQG